MQFTSTQLKRMLAMRNSTMQCVLIALVAAAPLAAQGGGGGGMGGMRMGGDPTAKVAGSGTLPPGWMLRFDPPRGSQPVPPMTAVSFVTMGTGFHVTGGPAAIYYNPKDMASGVYSVTATFHAAKSMQHESYGIFIGGMNLQDSTQNYLYMVINPMTGGMAIEHRSSNASPTKIVPISTIEPAVNKDGAADGSSTNTLLIHVAKDTVHFIVNGKLVKALAKSALDGAMTDGQPGLRINHNIDVHIDGWAVKQ
jgi:hypothetical protein